MSDKMAGGILAGSTSVSVPFVLRKTADNTEQTGKVAADMTLSYWRQGGTRTAITASDLAAVNSAYSSGGVKEVDATNQPGLYRLDLPDAAVATGADWVVVSVKVASCYLFHERYALTTNVVQSGDSYARLGTAGAGLTAIGDTRLAHLDADVSSRLAGASYTAPPSASTVAGAVWDESLAGHATAGSAGATLSAAGSAGDPWATALPGAYGAGTAGNIVGNNLDAAVSSRSTYAGADTSGTTTLLSRLTATRAGNLDNLDATVSSRSSHSAADVWAVTTRTLSSFGTLAADVASAVWGAVTRTLTAGTNIVLAKGTGVTGFNDLDASGVRSAVGLAAANLDTQLAAIDADVLTRLASASYTAPDNAGIAAIQAKTDNLPASPAAVSDVPTAAANADALLGRNLAGGADGGRTVRDALRALRNKTSIAGGVLTVTQEDDATAAWTAAVATTPGDPISSIDPA